jgi:GxxExxY protein
VTSDELDRTSNDIIGAAIEVHRVLGPGLLESAYEQSLAWELGLRKIAVRRQVSLPISYKELRIEEAYRIDMVVNESIVLELKCVDRLEPIHTAQLLTYLKMTGFRLGLLLNFRVDLMRNGIKRVVNGL